MIVIKDYHMRKLPSSNVHVICAKLYVCRVVDCEDRATPVHIMGFNVSNGTFFTCHYWYCYIRFISWCTSYYELVIVLKYDIVVFTLVDCPSDVDNYPLQSHMHASQSCSL